MNKTNSAAKESFKQFVRHLHEAATHLQESEKAAIAASEWDLQPRSRELKRRYAGFKYGIDVLLKMLDAEIIQKIIND